MSRDPYFANPAIIDSALADVSYTPDEVEFFGRVLDDVCLRAAARATVTEGLRTLLAAAILEGAVLGFRDHETLAEFALRVLPSFRRTG